LFSFLIYSHSPYNEIKADGFKKQAMGEAHEPLTTSVRRCTVRADQGQAKMIHKGAEEARNQLPYLLDAAEKGESTIISKHGRPVAVLAPIGAYSGRQEPLTPATGSGRGLCGKDSARAIRKLRDEWNR
jgi:prevent-host-death family protein